MAAAHPTLFTESFLIGRFADDFAAYRDSGDDAGLRERLARWANRAAQKETTDEGELLEVFFRQVWGYWGAGARPKAEGYSLWPKFPIGGAGQSGRTGQADLALGWFGLADVAGVPQVVCEFKDIRSDLDAPQRRKGNDRSPVKQAADYLKEASRAFYGSEAVLPTWALVTDMNEFRLYYRKSMPSASQRFYITVPKGETSQIALIDDSDSAAFQRFLFSRLFHRSVLLTTNGPSPLEKLITEQGHHERAIENSFYREYKEYRQEIFRALVEANPGFQGTRGKLVRLAQRLLDRCIFILFCEDMGAALSFPPQLLRDLLARESVDPNYAPDDTSVWHRIKRLFASMRDGSPFGDKRINRFNGGLFAQEPELEGLIIPNYVFCRKAQGRSPGAMQGEGLTGVALHQVQTTLLFFSATYNFGVRDGAMARSIGLTTLGRIFEQSITELEFMEAREDGRPSITELSKRKRDGVYYTPEWITYFIVEETVGAHLAEARRKLELDDGPTFTDKELASYQRAIANKKGQKRDKRPSGPKPVIDYLTRLDAYEHELAEIKVLDPACGSGAFLIQALERLIQERRWLTDERQRITPAAGSLFDIDSVTRAVLTENLYGVDINAESVEITRLALWLHSALPDRPLCSLDKNIRCGNSLVGPRFYKGQQLGFSVDERERINAFSFSAAFPEVFGRPGDRSGFDCIIGNPPYVKLQNFRKVDSATAEYLVEARRKDGTPLYESTQTQNFDLYLPFLEQGMELLSASGRMGFIAPSVWLMNEYGQGLRRKLRRTRRLERWIDFKDYQVFDEAITYTALQFFRGRPVDDIACMFAPDGKVAGIEWSRPDARVPYAELGADEVWTFAPDVERALLRRLDRDCQKLGEVASIIVGVQTSADAIYQLKRVASDRYERRLPNGTTQIVNIEAGLMRPIVSGEDAKRYLEPAPSCYVLFPYDDAGERARLYSEDELRSRYPKGWAYLESHEAELRARERGAFDDSAWYRFGRNQNIDKQKLPKLLIPRLTTRLAAAVDDAGRFVLDNVDVNGVLTSSKRESWFLVGVLDGPVANFVWRHVSKPFQNDFRSANKQFISPLPIPAANAQERRDIGERAEELQRLHTERRDQTGQIERRLSSAQVLPAAREPSWLWAEVGSVPEHKRAAPANLRGGERTAWAKAEFETRLGARFELIDRRLAAGSSLEVRVSHGELGLLVDGVAVIEGVFVGVDEADFIAAQWRHVVRRTNVTAAFGAKKLVRLLLDLRATDNAAIVEQVVALDAAIMKLDAAIAFAERAMNERLYALYGLSPEERALVEGDRPRH